MTQQFHDEATVGAYERLLMRRIFEPWGRLLLDRAALLPGEEVLDVATGPGTIARMAAARVGPGGRVHGVDLSPQMIAEAQTKAGEGGAAPIEYTRAPADELPFPAATFDAVLCQQGIQFFPDQPAAMKEMRRVLRPGGRAALALWADDKAMTLFASFLAAFDAVAGRPARPPLSWLDATRLAALFDQAGFHDTRIDEPSLVAIFDGGIDEALDCVDGTSVGAGVRAMDEGQRRAFEAAVKERLTPYLKGRRLELPVRALVAVGRA
jgi:SAM-dependent methyltransferase